jgi:hypothetical protein
MNYNKLLKAELFDVIEKLEQEKKQAVNELKVELEETKRKLLEKQDVMLRWMKESSDIECKLNSLNNLFSMLVHSFENLDSSTLEHPLTKEQEGILLTANSFRENLLKKAS